MCHSNIQFFTHCNHVGYLVTPCGDTMSVNICVVDGQDEEQVDSECARCMGYVNLRRFLNCELRGDGLLETLDPETSDRIARQGFVCAGLTGPKTVTATEGQDSNNSPQRACQSCRILRRRELVLARKCRATHMKQVKYTPYRPSKLFSDPVRPDICFASGYSSRARAEDEDQEDMHPSTRITTLWVTKSSCTSSTSRSTSVKSDKGSCAKKTKRKPTFSTLVMSDMFPPPKPRAGHGSAPNHPVAVMAAEGGAKYHIYYRGDVSDRADTTTGEYQGKQLQLRRQYEKEGPEDDGDYGTVSPIQGQCPPELFVWERKKTLVGGKFRWRGA